MSERAQREDKLKARSNLAPLCDLSSPRLAGNIASACLLYMSARLVCVCVCVGVRACVPAWPGLAWPGQSAYWSRNADT